MTLSIFLTFFSSLIALPDTSIHTTVEAQAIVSDAGVTPFWMRSLQYGSVPMENPGLVLRAWNGKNYNLKKKYDWKYEVEATGWTGKQNDFWLTQAYVSGRRGKWELWAGRRKEVYGLGDTTMTSGFYSWSGNAMPMPKVQLETRDYLNFAKGWLGVHMSFSHGLFDNQGLIKHAYLHQKSLYGRLGKTNSLFNIYGGINHQVSWGGEQNIKTNGSFDYFPSSLKAYFYVITLLKDRTLIKVDEKTSWDDANNQYGNHLGSIDFAVNLNLNLGSILLYKQTAYETGRIFSLVTADDGILGLSVKFKRKGLIEGFTFENLHTNNQGLYRSAAAKLFGLQDPHYPEYENYFNNHARGGWVYYKKSLGTPLIIVNSESQINGSSYSFKRNAVNSLYFLVYGHIKNNLTWMLKGSKSTHGFIEDGSNYPYSRYISYVNQFSSLIKLEKTFRKNTGVSVQLAVDSGKELKNTIGLAFSARYQLF